MKECLNCKKEYEAKRQVSKFCSTNCRVKWNNKSKEAGTKAKIKTLEDAISELLNRVQNSSPSQPKTIPSVLGKSATVTAQKTHLRYSFENLIAMKRDCESEDEWISLKETIQNSEHLSPKQRSILLNQI